MWPKEYKDYKIDEPLVKERVEPGDGIVGCQMHEINGWGNEIHMPRSKKRKGLLMALFSGFSKSSAEDNL